MLPYLTKLKKRGAKTIAECTPAYIGRNVKLLQQLSEASGINILTNTGYYAAADEKYLPAHAFTESSTLLAARWIKEWSEGIDGTGIRPGFIKLGVGTGPLKAIEHKLIDAAVSTHLKTGLKIAIHTGDVVAALEYISQISEKVNPKAVLWVHAQNDINGDAHIELAKRGCFISLDGVNEKTVDRYCLYINNLKQAGLLHKVLLSHDDGFAVNKQGGNMSFDAYDNGNAYPYQSVFKLLKPVFKNYGITEADFNTIVKINPAQAFKVEVCPAV
jgi:predicted metal-dependent phosphotriesterase family hydrolase